MFQVIWVKDVTPEQEPLSSCLNPFLHAQRVPTQWGCLRQIEFGGQGNFTVFHSLQRKVSPTYKIKYGIIL